MLSRAITAALAIGIEAGWWSKSLAGGVLLAGSGLALLTGLGIGRWLHKRLLRKRAAQLAELTTELTRVAQLHCEPDPK